MKSKTIERALVALAVFVCLTDAEAVSLTADGRGQVLLYPYYTAQGSNDTYFSVVNGTEAGKAVKVRFREGRNSRSVLDFNLYLARNSAWAAAVTRAGGGEPILRTFDNACTAPLFAASPNMAGATEIAFVNPDYAGYDRAGSGLDRAKEGFIEVIEMGEVTSYLLSAGSLNEIITPTYQQFNCAAVAAAWQAGGAFQSSNGVELSAPTGGLMGGGTLINVPQGTDYSYDPVALTKVYSSKRHTAPGAANPNLGEADPTSVAMVDGVPVTSTWAYGIDAVSAVLTHQTVINEYVAASPMLDAATDVILTFPTKSFYVVRESDVGQVTRAPFSAEFDDVAPAGAGTGGGPLADGASTGACEATDIVRYARDGRINTPSLALATPPPPRDPPGVSCWAASVFSLGNVLQSANGATIASHVYTTFGRIDLSFMASSQQMMSTEGHKYFGLPVIGFSVHKYINGNLGGVLSNYGGTLAHKYQTLVQ